MDPHPCASSFREKFSSSLFHILTLYEKAKQWLKGILIPWMGPGFFKSVMFIPVQEERLRGLAAEKEMEWRRAEQLQQGLGNIYTLHTHTHLSQLTSAVGSWFIHLLTGEESKILYSVQLRQLIYTDKNL